MSNLVCAAILPHGDVIPELGGPNSDIMQPTHLAMVEAGRRMAAAGPETIVIATPHGIRIHEHIGIGITEHAAGGLQGPGASIGVKMQVDQYLALAIAELASESGIPTARYVFGTGAGPESRLPLDWGAVIPLWYCGAQWDREPSIVVVVPDRSVDELDLVEFGRIVTQSADRSGKRVGFIASCDWAHAHDPSGPYGFHEDAAKFDQMALGLISSGDLNGFLGIDEAFIENAKPDGIWQTLVLAGVLEGSGLTVDVLSYQCPTYFGMLVAAYT
jgi:aromatic ring-opening dioxygenase LigB subunit